LKKTKYDLSAAICIISFPVPSVAVVNSFLYSLVEILEPLSKRIYLISGNISNLGFEDGKVSIRDIRLSTHFRNEITPSWWSIILQIAKIIIIQLKMSWNLLRISKDIQIAFFYVGGINLILPILVAKVFRIKIITSAIGLSSSNFMKPSCGKIITYIVYPLILTIEKIIFFMSDTILVESPSVTNFLGLTKYNRKIINIGARYINKEIFYARQSVRDRESLIGYIGRLDEAKGVLNFVKAIPLLLDKNKKLKFFIGGNGSAYNQIRDELVKQNLLEYVTLVGWIPHEEVAEYLNKLKIFVLPSYSEGLPTIILESLACGTPVLTTPIGGLPDIIKDAKTGFIMSNNSPKIIAENVLRVLKCPALDEIVENGKSLIETNYTYNAAIERYRCILQKTLNYQ